jgi:hypothetical protein
VTDAREPGEALTVLSSGDSKPVISKKGPLVDLLQCLTVASR